MLGTGPDVSKLNSVWIFNCQKETKKLNMIGICVCLMMFSFNQYSSQALIKAHFGLLIQRLDSHWWKFISSSVLYLYV